MRVSDLLAVAKQYDSELRAVSPALRTEATFLLLVTAMTVGGVYTIFRLSGAPVGHLGWIFLGVSGFVLIQIVPASFVADISRVPTMRWLYGALFFAVLPFAPYIGHTYNGATRYIGYESVRLESATLVTIALVLFFASWFSRDDIKTRVQTTTVIIVVILIATALLAQPHAMAARTVLILVFAYLLLHGHSRRAVELFCALAILMMFLVFMSPWRISRALSFLTPFQDELGSNYQVATALRAWRSGGEFGIDFGAIPVFAKRVPRILHEYAFAGIAEIWGKYGAIVILSIFLLQWSFILRVLELCRDRFLALLTFGLNVILIQSVLSSALIATGWHPAAEPPLSAAFFSYGPATCYALLICAVTYRSMCQITVKTSLIALPSAAVRQSHELYSKRVLWSFLGVGLIAMWAIFRVTERFLR